MTTEEQQQASPADDALSSAMAPMPVCATCAHFVPPREMTEAMRQAAINNGVDVMRGECRFMPRYERRLPSDWCGQHPELKIIAAGEG